MERQEWIEDVEKTAEICRMDGWVCKINDLMPYVSIEKVGSDEESYFFQGEEAVDLLDSCPEEVSNEDYLLFIVQGW